MNKTEYNKKILIKYLIWTFVLAYIVQFATKFMFDSGKITEMRLVLSGLMFIPTLGAWLSGAKFKNMGWRPMFRKNIKPFLIAWLSPLIISVVGAVLYFMFFPGHLDLNGNMADADVLRQINEQGMSYKQYFLIGIISSMTFGLVINTFVALGEEIGWRGFMYPQLKERFGHNKGWLLGGLIWGAWHWPLIILIGYEYGEAAGNMAGYAGAPVTGILVFCVFTITLGIMHDWLYEKSDSIWVPALFHGAINAAATLPLAICIPNGGSLRLLGPSINGILAGAPMIIIAVILLYKNKEA